MTPLAAFALAACAAVCPSTDHVLLKDLAAAFPGAAIDFKVDAKRQGIVDSWPAAVDDGAARRDWGFSPAFDFDRAFQEYLIPTIRQRYHR